MTHEEKIAYLDIACRIANIGIEKKALDLIVSLYDLVLQKEGKTSVEDVVAVKYAVDLQYETKDSSKKIHFMSTIDFYDKTNYSTRLKNCLCNRFGLEKNIFEIDEIELKKIRNIGKVTILEFKRAIKELQNEN